MEQTRKTKTVAIGQETDIVCRSCGRPFKVVLQNWLGSYRYCHRSDCPYTISKQPKGSLEPGRKWRSELKACSKKARADTQQTFGAKLLRSGGSRNGVLTYILQDPLTSLVKIGRSTNPYSRHRDVRRLSPDGTRLIGVCDANIEFETHKVWSHRRVVGEWFLPNEEMVSWIRGHFTVIREIVLKTTNELVDGFRVRVDGWNRLVQLREDRRSSEGGKHG